MASEEYPFPEIASAMKKMLGRITRLERELDLNERGAELEEEASPFPTDGSFSQSFYNPTIVQSVFSDEDLFTGKRAEPTLISSTGSPFAEDGGLTNVITVNIPEGASAPSEGDLVMSMFVGTAGTSPAIPEPRYMLAGGAGSGWRAEFVSEEDEKLVVWLLDKDDTKTRTISVAKHHHLRRSTYDGKMIGGVTYTYQDKNTRSASDGEDTETQHITPPYSSEEHLVIVRPVNGTGVSSVNWLELTSRQWSDEPPSV